MSKLNFFKQSHVAYHIKGNDQCSNMQANIIFLHPGGPLGLDQMSKQFLLHIKLYGMELEHHTYYVLTYTLIPMGGGKMSNNF